MANNVAGLYDRDGFYIVNHPAVPTERVKSARQGMDMVRRGEYDTGIPPEPSPWNPGDAPLALCKIEQPQKANRAIAELISSSEIGKCVAEATGADMVQVWWVQLLYKPPTPAGIKTQTKVGWHQDWTYWQSSWDQSSQLLTAWVALADVHESSGPMKFVPGSHKWKNVGGGDFFSQEITASSFAIPADQEWREESAVMPAGGFSLHNKLTLHGSSQNTSSHPRCSLAIHLRTDKSRPVGGGRPDLAHFIDDMNVCPIIHGSRVNSAFE